MTFCAVRVEGGGFGSQKARPGSSVVIVGGGLAGLSAATVLAERGVKVTLLEKESFLGGRAGAWTEHLADGTPFEMERGFHAFFRQYYNLRALMRRVDPSLRMLRKLEDYPILGPDGAMESFSGLPRHAPFNVVELTRRTPTLRMRDLPRISIPRALEMASFDPERTYAHWDDVSAKVYLDSLRFPPEARRMLFEVFAHSFFNPEEKYSAAELLMQFHFYFLGNPEGLIFDVMDRPFSKGLFEPLRRYLENLGVTIRLGAAVQRIERNRAGFQAVLEGETIEAEGLVLALSVPALKEVIAASPGLGAKNLARSVDSLDVTLPFAVWRLWLDRPLRQDRAPFVGTVGVGLLDNISLYHLFEDESRAWAERTKGSVVELHAYAVPLDVSEADLRADLLRGLFTLYPETKEARVLEDRYFVRRDCPAFLPGSHARRPTVETEIDGLFLAGDFVRLSFPTALMERATASGFLAANRLLARFGASAEPVMSVPMRGLLAGGASLFRKTSPATSR